MTELAPVDHDPFAESANPANWEPMPQGDIDQHLENAADDWRRNIYDPKEAAIRNEAAAQDRLYEQEAMRQRANLVWHNENDPKILRGMALDATPVIGSIRSGQAAVEGAQEGDWWKAGMGAAGAAPLVGGIFAGPAARTADRVALRRAAGMAEAGRDAKSIWQETGWFQGADNKWRFEIPDHEARLAGIKRVGEDFYFNELAHPELREAYGEAPVMGGRWGPSAPEAGGWYQPATEETIPLIHARGPGPESARATALHEEQHHIQELEEFARGGNKGMFTPEAIAAERHRLATAPDPRDRAIFGTYDPAIPDNDIAGHLYWRLMGEVEARNAATRRNMSPLERYLEPPWKTEDVPREQQIQLPRAAGGEVTARAPKDFPHARMIDGCWQIPDSRNPGMCRAI